MDLLLIDDHALFREGMNLLLERMNGSVELHQAESCAEAIGLLGTRSFDVVLLDLNLSDVKGLSGLALIRQAAPETPVVIVAASQSRADITQALQMGAKGYIPKSTSSTTMLNAIKLVLDGGTYLPIDVLTNDETPVAHMAADLDPAAMPLTLRQLEVLRLLSQGLANKEIGQQLDIAEPTVRAHITAAFKVLGVKNRTEASYRLAQLGWLDPSSALD